MATQLRQGGPNGGYIGIMDKKMASIIMGSYRVQGLIYMFYL